MRLLDAMADPLSIATSIYEALNKLKEAIEQVSVLSSSMVKQDS